MLCPRANSKFWNSPGGVEERPSEQSAFVAWGPWQPKPPDRDAWTLYEACGSYGTNSWLYNTVESQNRFWRNINVPQPATIPMFGDCTHIGAQPTENDDPPMFDGQWIDRPGQSPGGLGNSMVRFVLSRHGVGEANCTFFDLGVKVVGVKEWWRFKWSRVYDVRGQWTAEFYGGDPTRIPWHNWMKRYRDYP